MTLGEALGAAAAELGAAERRADDGVEWARGERVFAALTGDTAEFLLAPAIAAAALKTPDTGPSPRGRGWVAFGAAEIDRYALDRATAWFASGWRHAVE